MELNKKRIYGHSQLDQISCIPMAIESVLKLIGLMDIRDFKYQNNSLYHNKTDWFPIIEKDFGGKVKFEKQYEIFATARNHENLELYFDPLFETIDAELLEGRYVIISLPSGENNYHMHVIYNKISNDKYGYFTFNLLNPEPIDFQNDLKIIVREMLGTDIITYKLI